MASNSENRYPYPTTPERGEIGGIGSDLPHEDLVKVQSALRMEDPRTRVNGIFNLNNDSEVRGQRSEVLGYDGVDYLIIIKGEKPTNYRQLQGLIVEAISSKPDSSLLDLAGNWTIMNEFYAAQRLNVEGTPILYDDDGNIIFSHYTTNPNDILALLNVENGLNQKPNGPVNWSNRCFGPGLTCVPNKETKVADAERARIDIAVTIDDEIPVIIKQGVWLAYLKFIENTVIPDHKYNSEWNYILDQINTEQGRQNLVDLWDTTHAFQLTGSAIDIFCLLNPGWQRRSCRDLVQGKLEIDGRTIDKFGLHTYTDPIFADRQKVMDAMEFIAKEAGLDDNDKKQTLTVIEQGLEQMAKQTSILNRCEFTGWQGVQDSDTQSFHRFILMWFFLKDSKIHNLLDNSKIRNILELTNGWFPANAFPFHKSSEVALGTDLGSNNVSIIREFNNQVMRVV